MLVLDKIQMRIINYLCSLYKLFCYAGDGVCYNNLYKIVHRYCRTPVKLYRIGLSEDLLNVCKQKGIDRWDFPHSKLILEAILRDSWPVVIFFHPIVY